MGEVESLDSHSFFVLEDQVRSRTEKHNFALDWFEFQGDIEVGGDRCDHSELQVFEIDFLGLAQGNFTPVGVPRVTKLIISMIDRGQTNERSYHVSRLSCARHHVIPYRVAECIQHKKKGLPSGDDWGIGAICMDGPFILNPVLSDFVMFRVVLSALATIQFRLFSIQLINGESADLRCQNIIDGTEGLSKKH